MSSNSESQALVHSAKSSEARKKSLKGTWSQAIFTFFSPIVLVFSVRWVLIEPFVIPSESMVPNLLVHDHLFVNKTSFGLRKPFGNGFLTLWQRPERGDVVVFKYPLNPDVFYIKRLVGLPGDKIKLSNGRITLNGQEWPLEEIHMNREMEDADQMREFVYFNEKIGDQQHVVRFVSSFANEAEEREIEVPEGQYFMMGDNRDQSADSRVWGFVPEANLVGRASFIWLSCENTLASANFICDPTSLRWSRIFTRIH